MLLISRKWLPAVGGMETYCVKLDAELGKRARVERKVLPGRADGGAPGPAAILRFGLATAGAIAFRRKAPDIVHVTDMASWPLAAVAAVRSRRTKVVVSAHGSDVSYPDRPGVLPRAYGVYMRLGARLVGGCKVIANSRATEEKARALGFRSTEVIPLATDMTSALDQQGDRREGRRLLFAGRLIQSKGCRWFIENVLPALPPDVHLDVAGTFWEAEEERALVAPRVRYLGALPPDALRRTYAAAECVVVPNIPVGGSGFEGFGLVAAEAAAAGGLVLAAAHAGLDEAVLDGETGLKIPPGDAEAWVRTVRDVLGWPEARRRAFLERSVAVAGRHFSWDRVGRSTFEAYGWTP